MKGIGVATGTVILTPNERRVAEDRRDCYSLYVVTDCKAKLEPELHEVADLPRFPWQEVRKIAHYHLPVNAMMSSRRDR